MMKTWIKLALLSVVAVMLATCNGEKEKSSTICVAVDRVWMDVHHGENRIVHITQ